MEIKSIDEKKLPMVMKCYRENSFKTMTEKLRSTGRKTCAHHYH